MMSFWKKLIIGNLVCIKTRYSFKPVKILLMTKNTNLKTVILWDHLWLIPWGMLTKNYPFSGTLLSHNPLFGQKWYKQLWTEIAIFPKLSPYWEVILQSERPSMARVVARSKWVIKKWKKEQKKKWLSCHALEKFD